MKEQYNIEIPFPSRSLPLFIVLLLLIITPSSLDDRAIRTPDRIELMANSDLTLLSMAELPRSFGMETPYSARPTHTAGNASNGSLHHRVILD
jgi:hypothetical protein